MLFLRRVMQTCIATYSNFVLLTTKNITSPTLAEYFPRKRFENLRTLRKIKFLSSLKRTLIKKKLNSLQCSRKRYKMIEVIQEWNMGCKVLKKILKFGRSFYRFSRWVAAVKCRMIPYVKLLQENMFLNMEIHPRLLFAYVHKFTFLPKCFSLYWAVCVKWVSAQV